MCRASYAIKNTTEQNEVSESDKKTNVIRKERLYPFLLNEPWPLKKDTISVTASDVKPRNLAPKLRGSNCEGCHNVGLLISNISGNVKMLSQTLTFSGSLLVVEKTVWRNSRIIFPKLSQA